MYTNKKFIKSCLKRIDAIKEEDIDYSDIPPLDHHFFANATTELPFPKPKKINVGRLKRSKPTND